MLSSSKPPTFQVFLKSSLILKSWIQKFFSKNKQNNTCKSVPVSDNQCRTKTVTSEKHMKCNKLHYSNFTCNIEWQLHFTCENTVLDEHTVQAHVRFGHFTCDKLASRGHVWDHSHRYYTFKK